MALFEKFPLHLTNTLSREKELFKPAAAPFTGMYVCGPTVYGDPHLGHARGAVTFDTVFRYLTYLGYKVRYVRNITDVGHLEDEAAEAGEDKIAKRARLEKLEPMEVVQRYTVSYREAMRKLNTLPPSIEPSASGHIPEQIELVKKILAEGYAYESEGSVYFDLKKWAEKGSYGELSGKVLKDLLAGTRNTEGKDEKRFALDFALWKKAKSSHLMKWDSPWGEGFPGWHLECTAMSSKYLGMPFDIHGGGMDLKFPHHECEIAQGKAAFGKAPVTYWMHNNMLTIDGQKMAKSLGNFITLEELFEGRHKLLSRAWSPAVVRYWFLEAHYGSVMDFSEESLASAEKGLKRLMSAAAELINLPESTAASVDPKLTEEITAMLDGFHLAMSDDFNTPKALSCLFELSNRIQAFANAQIPLKNLDNAVKKRLSDEFPIFLFEILGLTQEKTSSYDRLDRVMQVLITLRAEARKKGDFAMSDTIRDRLAEAGVKLKDGKDATAYSTDG